MRGGLPLQASGMDDGPLQMRCHRGGMLNLWLACALPDPSGQRVTLEWFVIIDATFGSLQSLLAYELHAIVESLCVRHLTRTCVSDSTLV